MSWQFLLKVTVTAVLVIAISEAAKKWTLLGAIIASLPLTSILALIWLYVDTKDIHKVNSLSYGIFWAVIPSLVFFLALPLLIRLGCNFWVSLTTASACTALAYFGYLRLLGSFGVI